MVFFVCIRRSGGNGGDGGGGGGSSSSSSSSSGAKVDGAMYALVKMRDADGDPA
jgi:hypothetical protein